MKKTQTRLGAKPHTKATTTATKSKPLNKTKLADLKKKKTLLGTTTFSTAPSLPDFSFDTSSLSFTTAGAVGDLSQFETSDNDSMASIAGNGHAGLANNHTAGVTHTATTSTGKTATHHITRHTRQPKSIRKMTKKSTKTHHNSSESSKVHHHDLMDQLLHSTTALPLAHTTPTTTNSIQQQQQHKYRLRQQQKQTQLGTNGKSVDALGPDAFGPELISKLLAKDMAENTNATTASVVGNFFSALSQTVTNWSSSLISTATTTAGSLSTQTQTAMATAAHATFRPTRRAMHQTTGSNSTTNSATHAESATTTTTTTTTPTATETKTPMILGQLYKVGQEVEGFTVDTAEVYSSLSLAVYTFTHKRSQAQFVHIERDDTDNSFCVGFRTMPQDDTGVAHILEHTVLCGSKRYPARDPFFLMTRRSLSTFMNALTRAEATYYPFSTQNEQDFNNLLNVYLDSVFFPLIRKLDFKQEGHRIEPVGLFSDDEGDGEEEGEGGNDDEEEGGEEDGDKEEATEAAEEDGGDATTTADGVKQIPQKFEFKGVVFNEMKGDMSDPRSWLFGRISRHLHPTAIYRNNSGGDPIAIPNLTHEELVQFHAKHYHPGNAIFMTYGHRSPVLSVVNNTINEKLDELKQQYPDQVDSKYGENDFPPRITSTSAVDMVKNKKRHNKPFCIVEPGPTASLEDKERPYKASMTWLCRDEFITDITSPSLLNLDGIDLDEVETTIDFTTIQAEGADYEDGKDHKSTEDDGLASPNRVINDAAVIDGIIHKAQAPVVKTSKLGQKKFKTKEEWYDAQLESETIAGQALYESKIDEMMKPFVADGDDIATARQKAQDLLKSEHPELEALIPKPKQMKTYGTSNLELAATIKKIKQLSPAEQASLNLQFEQTALTFVSSLVFDNVYSPLYTLLTDPSLGTSASPTTGIDTWEHTPSFSMGFNGIKKGQVDMVLSKLFVALEEIAETGQGINASTMDVILHQTELSLKDHRKSFGVNMLQRLIGPFVHNQSIQHGYQVVDLLPLFRHVVETSGSLYFRTLIKYHILSNPHRLTYIMTPDPNLSAKLKEDEEALLASKTKDWTDADKLQCETDARELKAHQEAPVDDSSLPTLKISDIDPDLPKYRYTTFPLGGQVHIPVPMTLPNGKVYEMGTEFRDQYSPKQLRQQRQNNTNTNNINNHNTIDITNGDDRMTCPSLSEPTLSTDDAGAAGGDDTDPTNTQSSIVVAKQTNPILARPVTFNIQPTNGIVIVRALINDVGSRFTPYQLTLIPFLNLLFGHIGAGGRNYKDHSHTIEQTATDFSIQIVTDDMRIVNEDGTETFTNTLQASIKGKCLARNVDKMCALLVDSLTTPDYTEHVYNALAQYSGGLQSAVEENGPRFAMMDAQSRMPDYPHGQKHNQIHGLPHVQTTTALFKQIAADLQQYEAENGDGEEAEENSTQPPKPKKQSPLMMRLANDIAEAMRCLLLGPSTSQFTHTDTTVTGEAVSNANYFGPTSFQHITVPNAESTTNPTPNNLPIDPNNVNYSKHKHSPVYPNPHVEINQQSPLTFPFGFDRVLVTCDQNTANDPQYQSKILSGVNHLINGVYQCQPTAYQPENSLLALIPPTTATTPTAEEQDAETTITPPQSTPSKPLQSTKLATDKQTTIKPLSQTRNKASIREDGTVIHVDQNPFETTTPTTTDNANNASDYLFSYSTPPTPVRKFNYISAPVQVNNVVYCEKTNVTHDHPDFGPMQILCELVNEAFLHTEIREKGGAYGRFSSHDRNGIFSLGSIRDPQCLRTVDVFKRALVWLANTDAKESTTKEDSTQPGFNYTQQQLDEAKMALFASIDAPQSAGNRGLSPWLRNAEHSHRKALRASILNTTLDDIQRCARKHLNFDNALISVVGNQEKVPAEITDASNDPTGIWTLTLLDMEIDPDAATGGEDGDDEGDDE